MPHDAYDLRLLEIDIETIFAISVDGRIVRQNFPDCSPGPRFFLAGCPAGNLARVRWDLEDRVAARVLDIAAKKAPWRDFDAMPACMSKIAELLAAQHQALVPALIYELPNGLRYQGRARIVRGDSPEGERLLVRLAERGMPEYMVAAGFKSIADFWEPWCAALDGGDIASMCYAARLGDKGAEAGVYTFQQYRARGLAAAVTASWSSLTALQDRALFYSTSKMNRSSRRVAARLGLRQIGASISIS